MTDTLCPHGEPVAIARFTCTDCMNETPTSRERPRADGTAFTAQFESACVGEPDCAGVTPGEQIIRCTDGVYRHPGCLRFAR